jgi:hypothetical protein
MTVPETDGRRPFVRPADYYSSPTPVAVLPRGVTFGCAIASVVVLLIVFIAGALLSGGRFALGMDLVLGMSLGEMREMYAPDVTPQRKETVEAEIERMREHLRNGRVSVAGLQPFMEKLRVSISDSRVTAAEAGQLEETARKISATAKR